MYIAVTAAFFAAMIIFSIWDIKTREIPIWMIITGFALASANILYSAYDGSFLIMEFVLSLIPGLVMLLISFVTGQGLGYGDGLIALALGVTFGAYQTMMGLFVAVAASSLLSGVLLILKRAGRNTKLPFVPFMTFGMGVIFLAQI